jgi:hypothetical protein
MITNTVGTSTTVTSTIPYIKSLQLITLVDLYLLILVLLSDCPDTISISTCPEQIICQR